MARFALRLCTVLLTLVTASVVGTAAAHADTGGGCQTTSNAYVCISVRTGTIDPLIADYYIDNPNRGEYFGTLWVQFKSPSGQYFDMPDTPLGGFTEWPVGGHSPVFKQSKISCCFQARTKVIFRNSAGQEIYRAFSPWQYFS